MVKELKNKCPYCEAINNLELIAKIPIMFKVNEDGNVNFSVSNTTMIDKIDTLLTNFNEYEVKGHCNSCNKDCKCIITKDKKIIFVKEEDVKNE